MTAPTKSQIDALRTGIDSLVRRFKIAEALPTIEGRAKLNPIDMQALLYLNQHPGSTATALGQHLGVVATTTSALVDRLVRQGLILRHRVESNRRIVHLKLSPIGEESVAQIIETQNAHCRAMLEALAPEERAQLVGAIGKIATSIFQ